ncbi:MAG: CvpA family protein [Bacteroidetes bacterium]|nr:CvpA family protein [Bacteroidota bacterium]
MNFFDVLILGFLALFVINGFRKGFIISLASLAALILGIYLAVHFSNFIQAILQDNFHPSKTWLPILSFSLTFLVVVILVLMVAKVMEKIVDLVGMGIFNKLAGALLGLIKGVILASIILFILFAVDKKQKWITADDRNGSLTMITVEQVFPKIMSGLGTSIHFPFLNDEKKPGNSR